MEEFILRRFVVAAGHRRFPKIKRRFVLRAGAYELQHRPDVPVRVVVSEYVDIANAFVDADETGMVNAVLHDLGARMRTEEALGARGSRP